MPVTLKDIAEELNVSVNTVSHALRDLPDISQETTQLIKETAARLGYRKNIAASYLKTRKSLMLGVVVTDIQNPVFASMYHGIEQVSTETNYTIMLGNSNENAVEEAIIIDNMLNHGVDGIFLVPSMKDTLAFSHLEKSGIPYVLLQRSFPDMPSHYVQSDDFKGGYQAARHLYHLGHRSFLYVSAPMHISSARERYEGFLSYLSKKGLSEDRLQVLECESTRAGSQKIIKKWLDQQPDLHNLSATAIFCFSDYMAYGVYAVLSKYNLKIPEDISVIGYDNNEYSDLIVPALTTIDMHPNKIGKEAAKIMFELINTHSVKSEPKRLIISPNLVVRSSTAAPSR